MTMLIGTNDPLALVLELVMLLILGRWGYSRGRGRGGSAATAFGAVLVAALAWSAFAAPQAWIRLPEAGVLGVEALIFTCAATALAKLGHRGWAMTFAAVVSLNLALALAAGT